MIPVNIYLKILKLYFVQFMDIDIIKKALEKR